MSKNKNREGVVYSTDPDFEYNNGSLEEDQETLPNNQQKLVLKLDSKARAGKSVTIVDGFIGKNADLETLSKKIKTSLSVGGSVKDGQIIIQGDLREKLLALLLKMEYKARK